MNPCELFRTKTCICNRGWNEPSMPRCFSWWQANWETLTGEIICFCVHPAQATAFFCERAHFFVLRGKFPRYELLSRLETLTTPICLTTRNRWHAPVDKTRHSGRVSCQTLILTACFCWLCWDCLTMSCCSSQGAFSSLQTGLCSLRLDELVHIVLCEDMCTITTADSGLLLFFFRSRPRRSSMLETSSRLEESQHITESPLCLYFIPQIQTGICVIHARTWRNTLSF